MNSVAIVVPLYKPSLSDNEWIAVDRCVSVFGGKYPIQFVVPEGMDCSEYESRYKDIFSCECFDSSYFKGISGYNALMLSEEFYERFLCYDFILIYQADCYVFRDELEDWVSRGYDYIGAPWIAKTSHDKIPRKLYHVFLRSICAVVGRRSKVSVYDRVGNGGFSLRRTAVFHKVVIEQKVLIYHYIKNAKDHIFNEDVFWSFEPQKLGYDFIIPSVEVALRFSIDKNPARGLALNSDNLPFGCHGWNKDGFIDFWRSIIDNYGGEQLIEKDK